MTTPNARTANELAEVRTDLAESRTMMAADRTLMAWVRTALSMNSFGFTIYKVLQAYQEAEGGLPKSHTPRDAGLFLTAMGTFAMVMGTIEYWYSLKELRQLKEFRLARPSFIMALVMSATGVLLFAAIVFRVL